LSPLRRNSSNWQGKAGVRQQSFPL